MPELRTIEYNVPITSFGRNQSLVGAIEPGRYRGWDTPAEGVGPGIVLDLTHDNTGISKTDINNVAEPKRGIVIMRTGVTISNDDKLTLTIDDNVGNSQKRVDLIVIEHEFIQVQGGQPASYLVIKGPNEDPSVPALPNPEKQIILGRVELAAGASTYGDITYTYEPAPTLANEPFARLNEEQSFTENQTFEKTWLSSFPTIDVRNAGPVKDELVNNQKLVLSGPSNVYSLLTEAGPGTLQNVDTIELEAGELEVGTKVTIFMNPVMAWPMTTFYLGLNWSQQKMLQAAKYGDVDSNRVPMGGNNQVLELVVLSFNSSTKEVRFAITAYGGTELLSRTNTFSRAQTFNGGVNYRSGQPVIKELTFDIGAWDMSATQANTVSYPPGLIPDFSKIMGIRTMIISDDDTELKPIDACNSSSVPQGGVERITASGVTLQRLTAGEFDSISYDDTAKNRGYITLMVEQS